MSEYALPTPQPVFASCILAVHLYCIGTFIFHNFFLESFKLLRTLLSLDGYLSSADTDSKKNYVGRCVELCTKVAAAASSNILVPSAHSIGESPSQVPGRAVRMS